MSLKIKGMDIEDLLEFPEVITTTIAETVANDIDKKIYSACIAVNVNPKAIEILSTKVKQLQDALDICGVNYVGARFSDYIALQKENERLYELLNNTVQLGGNAE